MNDARHHTPSQPNFAKLAEELDALNKRLPDLFIAGPTDSYSATKRVLVDRMYFEAHNIIAALRLAAQAQEDRKDAILVADPDAAWHEWRTQNQECSTYEAFKAGYYQGSAIAAEEGERA